MRAALWFLALFGMAVAVSLLAGNNQGTVTLFWPPYRIDLSLNFVLLLLFAGFTLVYLALRALSALQALPRQAQRWRMQQKERAMHGAMLDAVAQLLAGRFVRARKAAQTAIAQEQALAAAHETLPHGRALRTLASTVAAESSHALQDRSGREEYLAQALEALAQHPSAAELELRDGVQLRAARWSLDEHDANAALERLATLQGGAARRTLTLRTRLKAARLAGRSQEALETARLLAKHGAFAPGVAATLVRTLATAVLDEARDPAQLERAWQRLEGAERAMPDVAIHAAECLMRVGGSGAQARQWLLPVWQQLPERGERALGDYQVTKLVHALERCMDGIDTAWLGHIEAGQRARPNDPRLQYVAAVACMRLALWGKAQQWLDDAAERLDDPALAARAWCHLAELAEQRGDAQAAGAAWKRAARHA